MHVVTCNYIVINDLVRITARFSVHISALVIYTTVTRCTPEIGRLYNIYSPQNIIFLKS